MIAKKDISGNAWLNSDETVGIDMKKTACPCCGKNEMQQEVIDFYGYILRFIDIEDIYITSGYRCPEHNKKVGGAGNSAHVKGMALDITVTDKISILYAAAEMGSKLFPGGTGIGFYPRGYGNIVHIDRRITSARWIKLEEYQRFTMQFKKEYLK